MLRRILIIATCFLLVGFIGWLDYITGFENSLLIFYLAPIAIGTWFLGIGFGIAIAILCVIATILADLAAGVPRVPVWNCGTAFVAYLIFSFLLRRWHSLLSEMHLRVKERTADLQRELARRQQLEKEIAVVAEEERTRVGRELHDSLGQHLAGTGLLAETVANQLEKENNTIRPTARKVVRLIDQGIELTREIARGLYSSELDGDGLFSALESLSRSVGKGQVKCEFEHSGKPPRSKELATQVYWVAREAVTNALKHGQPQHVTFQFLKAMETIHFYFIYGLMDEQIWRGWWNLYRHYLASPGLEHYWTLRHDLFSERFQRFVNQMTKPGEPMTVANLLGTEVKS